MDHSSIICSVINLVENRLKTEISYNELEKETGFSIAYIREIFAKKTGKTLSRYILERRICNAAFEISHAKENLLAIAVKYGFTSPDTFTRAFRRVIGMTPSEFRKKKIIVGRIKLCTGLYGVGFTANEMLKMKGNDSDE